MIKKSKHILIAIHRYQVGGAETQALYLAEGLKRLGYKITISAFGSRDEGGISRFIKLKLSTCFWGFNEKLILENPKKIKLRIIKILKLLELIYKVRKLKVDIIVPFTYPPNVIFCSYWKLMNVKKCLWNQRDAGISFEFNSLEQKALSDCSEIVSNSLRGLHFLKRITDRHIHIIHNGVKVPPLNASSCNLDGKFQVVMIANLHRYKDHLTLLKAWKIFMKDNHNAKLLLAGNKGDSYSELLAYAKKENLDFSIEFLGQVDSIPKLLYTCHLGVFSSIDEGLPNGILECMASGLPIIATDIEGAREALGNDYQWLVPIQDEFKMAKMIGLFYQDKFLRDHVASNNLARVRYKFSISHMVESYCQLL